ncbi:hypothetical protein BASA81_002683 [Batrachochytrium salamandrivorans]|nr:hypothetical protein BASA81_002683 [Batrachochytrium salamandrivorans]
MFRRSISLAVRRQQQRQFTARATATTAPVSQKVAFAACGLAAFAAVALTQTAKTHEAASVAAAVGDHTLGEDDLKHIVALLAEMEKKLAMVSSQLEEMKQAPTTALDKNRAFIFIKPHANTTAVQALVDAELQAQNFTVTAKGQLSAEEIGSKIDIHYGAIASKAARVEPKDLTVPAEGQAAFESKFGQSWKHAVETNQVLNAKQACEKLGVTGDELEAKWRQPTTKLIKFGGGFYCGQIELEDGSKLFVINGFYMQMRGRYTTPPAAITYYEVEFAADKLNWQDFRSEFLGATDPAKASPTSLRRKIYDNWQALGLPQLPDVGDNGMHGSASPFEAVAEVVNWEGKDLERDPIGQALLQRLDKATLELWLGDCQVPSGGKTKSIFDLLEDLSTREMLAKLDSIVAALPAKVETK